MSETTACHCDNLRSQLGGAFSWNDFDELSCVDTYPDSGFDCQDHTVRCKACGSVWRLRVDHTPVIPRYDFSEITKPV